MSKPEFNTVEEIDPYVHRRRVAGGWIYTETWPGPDNVIVCATSVFVPDAPPAPGEGAK